MPTLNAEELKNMNALGLVIEALALGVTFKVISHQSIRVRGPRHVIEQFLPALKARSKAEICAAIADPYHEALEVEF